MDYGHWRLAHMWVQALHAQTARTRSTGGARGTLPLLGGCGSSKCRGQVEHNASRETQTRRDALLVLVLVNGLNDSLGEEKSGTVDEGERYDTQHGRYNTAQETYRTIGSGGSKSARFEQSRDSWTAPRGRNTRGDVPHKAGARRETNP